MHAAQSTRILGRAFAQAHIRTRVQPDRSLQWLTRIQTVFRTALALCQAARLSNLKAFDKKIADLCLTQPDPNLGLRTVNTQELLPSTIAPQSIQAIRASTSTPGNTKVERFAGVTRQAAALMTAALSPRVCHSRLPAKAPRNGPQQPHVKQPGSWTGAGSGSHASAGLAPRRDS